MSDLHPDLERLLDEGSGGLRRALGDAREAAVQRDIDRRLRSAFRGRPRPGPAPELAARVETRLAERRAVATTRRPGPVARMLLGLYWLAALLLSGFILAPRIELGAMPGALAGLGERLALGLVPETIAELAGTQIVVLATVLLVLAPAALRRAAYRLIHPLVT